MKLVTELLTYSCGDCNSEEWILRIGHRSDGNTRLIITCANELCVQKKREEQEASKDQVMIWDDFDITGQGHDAVDHRSFSLLN